MDRRGRTITLTTTGFSEPVFLCPNANTLHMVLVTPKAGYARLEYTYDPPSRIRNYPHSVAWIEHDAGAIRTDMGDCLWGEPSAIRLRLCGPHAEASLTIKPYQPERVDNP
ncbi:MAG: hypothetical protein GC134_01865 [Proteobacteria bacterium]|nr:hypothetical protein [Pseudomonadota bacterium]